MKPLAALLLVVSAGDYDRVNPIVSVAMREADLGPLARQAAGLALVEVDAKKPSRIPAQWDPHTKQLVFILPGATRRGTTRTFRLVASSPTKPAVVATVVAARYVGVRRDGKPVLRYNFDLMKQFPDKPSEFDRACYFHPLWAPCGEIITGDFNPNHLHHRGLWFAWVKARVGGINANFWEIQQGRGKTVNRDVETTQGSVFAGLVAKNDWLSGGKTILKETLLTRVYATPDGPHILDLIERQDAPAGDITLGKIHYGGIGFRGRDEWDGRGAPVLALTSEGKRRKDGNATNARWVDYTGPLPRNRWGGVILMDHPANPRHPNRVRIHPTMCFFSSTLVQTAPYTIKRGRPLVLRYRLALHDGKPDGELAERLFADFAHPPEVEIRRPQ